MDFLDQANPSNDFKIVKPTKGKGKFRIYDFSSKSYQKATYEEIISLKIQRSLLTNQTKKEHKELKPVLILIHYITKKVLSNLVTEFDLNPLLIWEIILVQNRDKYLAFDEFTTFYNISVQ